ncbi:MAG TPA: carboxypeptidase-like regulatory domain-containing protein [Candidatus Saccharimonadales bacterium]|nr:carboxypeptidase-like regulatory domain-containing protein [Candidatus Saccharimonadales bacterium]
MKRNIIGMFLFAALLVGAAPQTVHAAAQEVIISGVVFDQGQPVPGIQVQVECWETAFVQRPITDATGKYRVVTTADQCPLGTTLKVRSNTALNAKVGFKFSTVQLGVNNLPIHLILTHGVPEYGWAPAFTALAAGVGLVIFNRRRAVNNI